MPTEKQFHPDVIAAYRRIEEYEKLHPWTCTSMCRCTCAEDEILRLRAALKSIADADHACADSGYFLLQHAAREALTTDRPAT